VGFTEVSHSSVQNGKLHREYIDILRGAGLHVQIRFQDLCLPLTPLGRLTKAHLHNPKSLVEGAILILFNSVFPELSTMEHFENTAVNFHFSFLQGSGIHNFSVYCLSIEKNAECQPIICHHSPNLRYSFSFRVQLSF
jgi:hypothetical protein